MIKEIVPFLEQTAIAAWDITPTKGNILLHLGALELDDSEGSDVGDDFVAVPQVES